MDLPQPPEDVDLKNIIDKLANFVARNGPEFEQMTKQKQKDNPKFSFLFGGEHFNYYQYKVTTEQAILNQHKQKAAAILQTHVNPQQMPPWQQVPPQQPMPQQVQPGQIPLPQAVSVQPNAQEQHLQQQIQMMEQQLHQEKDHMKRQVTESEGNLAAHHAALMRLKETQIEQAVEQAREEDLLRLCQECDVKMSDLDMMVQPIIEACTKDNISNGKNWIFSHSITPEHGDLIAQYLLKRISMNNASFEMRLHLIYLMNDVLHHCVRKNMEDLLRSMRKVVVPICHTTFAGAEEDKKQKLNKLVSLWEQHKYFDMEIIQMLKDPRELKAIKEQWRREYPQAEEQASQSITDRYNQLQHQHQEFVSHLQGQVHKLEAMLQQQQQALQQLQAQNQAAAAISMPSSAPPPTLPNQGPPVTQIPGIGGINTSQPPPNAPQGFEPPPAGFPPPTQQAPPPQQQQPQTFDYSHGSTPTPVVQEYNHGQGAPSTVPLPDFSKPPPGFQPPSIAPRGPVPGDTELTPSVPYYDLPGGLIAPLVKEEGDGRPKPTPLLEMNIAPPTNEQAPPGAGSEDLTPTVPYFDLPAALLAPLVKLEDHEYKPLDPKHIRLPPPVPPSERLLAAVEAFYSQPTHERPRDSEGWEKLGLFEFYKAKEAAKKMKAEQSQNEKQEGIQSGNQGGKQNGTGFREKSPSRSRSNSPSSRSSSKSRSDSRSRSRSRSRSPKQRSPPRRRYRSRSKSPEVKGLPHMASYSRRSRSRSQSDSRSRSDSRSGSSRSRSGSRSRSRSSTPPRYSRRKSRSRSRSASPPSFLNLPGGSTSSRLGMENKGHQLLTKMGWGGAGLGKAEQGRVDPIEAADARDNVDLYKGVGMDMKDPFEQFRKNKAGAFIHRMRTRDKTD